MSISSEQARAMLRKAGQSPEEISTQLTGALPMSGKGYGENKPKYGNKRTYSDTVGRNFDSDGERRFGEVLWARQKAGEISDLCFQVSVTLLGAIRMRPDFRYVEDGAIIHHEFKGREMSPWQLQVKIWRLVGPTEYRTTFMGNKPDDAIFPQPNSELIKLVLRHLVDTDSLEDELNQLEAMA